MKILLVLAGKQPGKTLLEETLANCDLSLAVDGGLQAFTSAKKKPDLVIGDLDSARMIANAHVRVIHTPDQNYTDLQKAFNYLLKTYHNFDVTILGSGGLRTDHLINNLQICASQPPDLKITLINEPGSISGFKREIIYRITPQTNNDLTVNLDAELSIFHLSPYSGLTASGLKWPVTAASSTTGFFSQSNRSISDTLKISLIRGSVYLAVYQ